MSAPLPSDTKPNNTLWGGRFSGGPSTVMAEINASIGVDQRLWQQDIAGSKAHAAMLAATGIITPQEADAIHQGLDQIALEIADQKLIWRTELEDIHMHIEARLAELIGEPARRLHTARSRNDQVATDFKLWVRSAIDQLDQDLHILQNALVERAEEHAYTVLPGTTHLQAAQPVTLGHHFLAYVEMLRRDRGRFADARRRLNECPLGSAALAGTSFPIDRTMTATSLGFDAPTRNSLDAVSDRDFALEFLSSTVQTGLHLSRLAEEIIIWASQPYHFILLSDAFSTGSSIMPQKRNPDAAELIRAKSGLFLGAFTQLATIMKGLPLAYAKDMQDDKAPVFQAYDTLTLCLAAMTGMVQTLTIQKDVLRAACAAGYITATDFADWLVREANIPFREAHHITGQAVRHAETLGCDLSAVPLVDLQNIDKRITQGIFDVLSPENSVSSRVSYGGTAPDQVRTQIAAWKQDLCSHKK